VPCTVTPRRTGTSRSTKLTVLVRLIQSALPQMQRHLPNEPLMKPCSKRMSMHGHRRYLVTNPRSRTGAPYPMTHEVPFGLLDLSNPKTVAWMESIIAAMALSAGVDPTSGRPRVQACALSAWPVLAGGVRCAVAVGNNRRGVCGCGVPQGWMADFGEYLPFDAHLASGEHPVRG
jgi:hypothetical protein